MVRADHCSKNRIALVAGVAARRADASGGGPQARRDAPSPEFERDREALEQLIASFPVPRSRYAPHPMFGQLTRDEWMVWGYRHADHHLRQFGL